MKINQWLQSNPMEAKLKSLERQARKSNDTTLMSASDRSIAILEDNNQKSFTIEEKKGISAFLQKADGDDQAKLNTVQTAINKGVTLSEDNLMSMHKALNETPLSVDQLESVYLSAETGEGQELTIGKLIDDSALPESVKSVIKEAISQGKPLKEAVLIGLKKILSDANLTQSAAAIDVTFKGDVNALLKSISAMLNQNNVSVDSFEASLQGIAEGAEMTLADLKQFLTQLVQVVSESMQAKEEGLESLNRLGSQEGAEILEGSESLGQLKAPSDTPLSEGVNQLQETEKETETVPLARQEERPEAADDDLLQFIEDKVGEMNDQISDVLSEMVVKMYAVKESTVLTESLKQAFHQVQNEVTDQLSQVIQSLESSQSTQEPIQSKPVDESELIAKAIEKLNQTITKSDLTLYTSMKNERDLLVASSDLTKARQLLAEGKQSQALTILKKTHDLVNKMVFTPEKKRVELFATRQINRAIDTIEQSDHRYKNQQNIKSVLQMLSDDTNGLKARNVVETVRFMGVNHEVELANQMDQKEQGSKNELVNANVKEILIKLAKEEADKRTVEQTASSLMNLNGQQMMNDFNQRERGQSYFFNYPIEVEGESENMKVFLSGKGNQQLDWQNAEMVFGLETEKYGQVGIRVKAVAGQLEIKVLSDGANDLSEQLLDLEDAFLDLGYSDFTLKSEIDPAAKTSTSAQALGDPLKHQQDHTRKMDSPLKEGGFDFKI